MNERIKQLAIEANLISSESNGFDQTRLSIAQQKFAELIVREMCGMMEQAEDDAYHCFEPSERPTEYIEWLNQWRTRFENYFGVKE
jgi:hypothetical protein